MSRFWSVFLLWLGLTSAAVAQCSGSDLRGSLSAEERALLTTELAATPYPVGNHWRAEKDGEIIHLVGTMHLGDPRMDAVAERLQPLIETAGAVLLEMTAAEKSQLETALKTRPDMLLLTGSTLTDFLPEADWQMLEGAMAARGLPSPMAARLQPWYAAMLLSLPVCMMSALAEANGLDARVEALADAAGVPTKALEAYDVGFRVFNDMPLEMQVNMMRASLTEEAVAQDLMATLLASYFDEAHAESWISTRVLSPRLSPLDAAQNEEVFAVMQEGLLDRRNRAWLPVILNAAEATNGPIVAAFGAAHLHGETGVLNLLAQEGFTLTRQPF